ncbi:ROK family protein [Mycetocola tolaasinivorans]|uniref:ROK family protein n=1 Tax=Mycetocola tolaasinivorans TaxID=76635 RepID=A0A3L7A625_9MICO|nr:ROK family protein [Mycetocola tolaasinivorans]RLP75001.1 ROK family protein [Mycetocola tolaasinivorans]
MDFNEDVSEIRGVRLHAPRVAARLPTAEAASTFARLIASGTATTRSALARETGLSRTTVTTGVDYLFERNVLLREGETETLPGGRGRPSDSLALNPAYGSVLVADLGIASTQISLYDMEQRTIASRSLTLDLSAGPETSVPELVRACVALVKENLERVGPLRMCVIGVPGPVDARRGEMSRPPILRGWTKFPLADAFRRGLGCPVTVEKDVGLRALGEARSRRGTERSLPLIYIKVASGIEAGIVTADGRPYRGANDAAGDLGHVWSRAAGDAPCTCGNTGCLATIATTTALVRLRNEELGLTDAGLDEFEEAVRLGEPVAVRILREAASAVGEAAAGIVNFFNPARIVLGGSIAAVSDDILSGVRGAVYQRSLPLATHTLEVSMPHHGHLSGAAGGLVLALERIFAAESLDAGSCGIGLPRTGPITVPEAARR